ncbi:DUF4242 domain-containing protein [Conexibacter sp. JD483]|uniref:DUF4242 domain-containing protein n=1 Tax=unclassified Conexibacter TaxID=2627773 RepID=UPI00271F3281|nr:MULTISPECIES: DUF4242 domain-containing protein [unclassified Conexibacter]MDO8186540.1 DUF4242 domain-containing protein [Conexibacter sp. CPCC 205706]MDO8200109.1 DUF4242 domain-containing protein [Conexibacter sp. CPCC 205762]MDR9371991.1 DUF4242 domain-containing protein [Conexibacter sp. JD483]
METLMQQYVILRRGGFASLADLQTAGARSAAVADEQMPDDVRWIRSYVLDEADATVGTVCIYEATSQEAIRRHAAEAQLPVTEILPLLDTVIVRPDPQPQPQ